MFAGKKILGIITARGGSKGIPRKNVIPIGGKPLIGWTIEAALASRYIDRLILSSDDPEIIRVAKSFGCDAPFERDASLATDTASSADVVEDALRRVPGYEYFVLLQPTSPLRLAEDIDACVEKGVGAAADSCVSVTEAEQSPYWMYRKREDGSLEPLLSAPKGTSRRQDLPKSLVLNGAIYVVSTNAFLAERKFLFKGSLSYEMPASRSLDIDTELDLKLFKIWYQELNYGKD